MNTRILLLFACLFYQPERGFTQEKTVLKAELSQSVLDQFTCTLPPFVSAHDPALMASAVDGMVQAILPFMEHTDSTCFVADPTILENTGLMRILLDFHRGKYADALGRLRQHRLAKRSPPYRAPYLLDLALYCRLMTDMDRNDTASLSVRMKHAFEEEISVIPTDFRSDVLYQLKGNYTTTQRQNLEVFTDETFRQIRENSGNEISFEQALYILQDWMTHEFLRNFQPEIDMVMKELAPFEVVEDQVMIPLRDGVRLSAYVYRVKNREERVPALISLSPYPGGFEPTFGNVYATNGYVYVYVDTRGRRGSEGLFFPFEHDAQDFHDVIDWASRQPWCDGQVGTTGGSYLGFAQWQAIRKKYRHPALKAINPMVSVGFGLDFPKLNQIFYPYTLQWALYVSGKDLNEALFSDWNFWKEQSWKMYRHHIPFCQFDSLVGMPNPYFQKWISHPDMDHYWKDILPSRKDYKKLDLPVFTITGYYDADQLGARYYYDNHQRYGKKKSKAKHQLLIGPFDHSGAQWKPSSIQGGNIIDEAAQIPVYKYVIRWFDHVLKGHEQPAFMQDRVCYYHSGKEAWDFAPDLRSITTDSIVLYLNREKIQHPVRRIGYYGMTATCTRADTMHYDHDITTVVDSSLLFFTGSPLTDTTYLRSPHNLLFDSQPFEKNMTVAGSLLVRLRLSINVPDADMQVKFYDIDSTGASTLLCNDLQRLRYRNGFDKPQLAGTGEILNWNIDKTFIDVRELKRGHRLRMELQFVNEPSYQKNFGFGGDVSRETTDQPRWFRSVLYLGEGDACRVVVPLSAR